MVPSTAQAPPRQDMNHPPPSLAFDDDHRSVQTVDFDYAAVDGDEPGSDTGRDEELRRIETETLGHLIDFFLSRDQRAKVIGEDFILLAYLGGKTAFCTQRQLAIRLGWTPGRVSQRLARLCQAFPCLARRKRRPRLRN